MTRVKRVVCVCVYNVYVFRDNIPLHFILIHIKRVLVGGCVLCHFGWEAVWSGQRELKKELKIEFIC